MMNWNTSTDCCNWDGVTCDLTTGDVIGIDLSCGRLKGTIHPNTSLFNLPHLQKLSLSSNDFDGSKIPREIGRFSNSLTHLSISGCWLSGQVPPDITLLHKLVYLDLSANPELKLRRGVFINLIHNVTNLEGLALKYVNISSVLPHRLNISSFLKFLYLPGTGLKGKLPHYIFNLHSLEKLDLSVNTLTGDIPSDISVNLTHLTYLNLYFNKLNGTLPSWLFTSPSLEYLYLDNNMFSGNVPFESFALSSLKVLGLSDNQLVGHTDVQTFRRLTNLTHVGLSYNNFSGELELDTLLSSLTNLDYLYLSYSGFSLTTKNANHYVNPAFRLLFLASCKLKVFPNSFRAMRKLEWLDLSSNEIYGQIPHWAGEIGGNELYHLNLSHNFITGLPQFQWYGLTEVYLQSNMIQGPFPPSICNMSNLTSLDISDNSVGGVIPECVGSMNKLFMINLGTNKFHGTIPNVFNECRYLEGLILNGNQLEGEVPHSLSKCQSLKVVDLGNNKVSGTFPEWLGGLLELQVLVLKSNNFHGPIETSTPIELAFSSLQVLDLSHNWFAGKLPGIVFQNFKAMQNMVSDSTQPKYLLVGNDYYTITVAVKDVQLTFTKLFVDYTIVDLSNNRFEGEIPNTIGSLNSLKVLNLSHNNLNGEIPKAIGNISGTESLDLSWNQLIGEIPQSLAEIKGLAVLNLSQNDLVGRIPEGPQFSTFEGNSFGGNPKLCGTPLPKKCGKHSHEPQLESHEEESDFTWEVVTLGFGCGTLLGLVMGYLMLSTRKVKWLNAIADATESLVLKKMKKKRRHIYIGK
ncbi:leucine-rich repeat-containing protein [Tanacetum coccineum]|uniref:Leucine-rich repeat-containing protein n=1 Tax=Tanacetum coccineum TaxID=301880 RepID=A0ABQ5I2J9_9ASTR